MPAAFILFVTLHTFWDSIDNRFFHVLADSSQDCMLRNIFPNKLFGYFCLQYTE